jgi:hypothetical protein
LDSELKQINTRSNWQKQLRSNQNLPATSTGTSVGRQTTTALILKAVTAAYPQASPDPLHTTPSTSTHRNTLINSATVTCFKCGKDNHFTSSCPEPKDIVNIKEIKEEKMSNKSGKEKL